MSGGSYSYVYCRVEEECVNRMFDSQLNEMMKDLVKVLHDLEWWQSSDTGEDTYRMAVTEFKKKWFKQRLMYRNKSNQSLKKQRMS